MVRIDPCHGSDPGSIPGSFVFFILFPKCVRHEQNEAVLCVRTTQPKLGEVSLQVVH